MDVFDFIAGNGKRFYKGKDEVEEKEDGQRGQYEPKMSVDKEKIKRKHREDK